MRELPFTLHSLHIQNLFDIREIKLENLPNTAPWIFLTGENGFGKTLVLQGVAQLTFAIQNLNKRGEIEIRPGLFFEGGKVVINIRVNGEGVSLNWEGTSKTSSKRTMSANLINSGDKVLAYGPSRLQIQAEQSENQAARNSGNTYSLFYPDANLKNIEYELKKAFYKESGNGKKRYQDIQHILTELIPSLAKVEVKEFDVLYYEQSENGESFQPVRFAQLAAGAKSIVAMAGDIYLRLIESQPDKEVQELEGMVLIDELDLHLHPKWQKKLPGLLSEVFPNIQFIASTHSPIPMLGAPKGSVVLTVHRNAEEGITLERMDDDIDLTELTPEQILTSPIFGFHEIIHEELKDLDKLRTEDNYEEVVFHKKLEEKLREFAKKGGFPEDIFKK